MIRIRGVLHEGQPVWKLYDKKGGGVAIYSRKIEQLGGGRWRQTGWVKLAELTLDRRRAGQQRMNEIAQFLENVTDIPGVVKKNQ